MVKNKSHRLLSLFLAFIMLFTMMPIQVFGESLHNGLSAPYTWKPSTDYVAGSGNLINDLKSMNAYKLSVWFAQHNGYDENGNPTFDWDNPEQIGETYFWRRTPLQTKSGQSVGLDFWNMDNIYNQTSEEALWGQNIRRASKGDHFDYAATDWQLRNAKENNESWSWTGRTAYFNNLAMGLRAINTCGYTLYEVAYGDSDTYSTLNGFNEVRDFFARIVNMENPGSVDLKKFYNIFNKYYLGTGHKVEDLNWDIGLKTPTDALYRALVDTVGEYYGKTAIIGKYYDTALLESQIDGISNILANQRDFQLPFPATMKEKDNQGKNDASAEYLKSYFLNPLILNEISWMTGNADGNGGGYWQTGDFIRGELYKNGRNSAPTIGQYKIYIEPCMIRKYSQEGTSTSYALMTWRDLMSAGEAMINRYNGNKSAVYKSFIGNMYMAAPQIANAMMLENEDVSLKVGSDIVGGKGLTPAFTSKDAEDVWSKNGVYTVLTDPLNTLGVSIVTSPSTATGHLTPQIVKTYVIATGVDSNGKIIYEKADETVSYLTNDADYYLDDAGNLTVHPKISYVEELESGFAVLNDMFTTPYTLIVNEDSEWTNTDLITNVGLTKGSSNAYVPETEEATKSQLEPIATDVAGYYFGIITGSDLFIEGIRQVVGPLTEEEAARLESGELLAGINNASYNLTDTFASAKEEVTLLPRARGNDLFYRAIKDINSVKFNKKEDVGIGKVAENHIEKIDFTIDQDSYESLYTITTPANTLVLRYLLTPTAKQVNLVRFFEKDSEGNLTETHIVVEDPVGLVISGDTVTIQEPISELPDDAEGPAELVKWVTNSEYPVISLTDSLPPKSVGGKEGTTPGTITGYPTDPLTHNLYVEWKVIVPKDELPVGANQDVPEWRISKYLGAITDEYEGGGVLSATMNFTKKEDVGCKPKNKSTSLTPYGTYSYKLVNANGRLSNGDDTPANMKMNTIGSVGAANIDSNYAGVAPNSWFHSKTFVYGGDSDYISHADNNADMDLDATLNMIKSDDSGALTPANWLSGNDTGLSDYTIYSGNKPKGYSGSNEYLKIADLRLGIYNSNTYTHIYGSKYRHHGFPCYCCKCETDTETISPSSSKVTYTTANYSLDVNFDRYVQKDTTAYTLSLNNNDKYNITNSLTTIKYQLADSIKIYPEVGMLFDDDTNKESIRWIIGDKVREIKPVVYQTLEHKVYVKPTSTGTSVANDSRGITKANSIGEAGKQIIYKGAGVNTNFRLYQSKDSNKVALLTIKTYALDINNNGLMSGLKAAWGNSSYDSYAMHKSLLSNFQAGENSKATVTEKLLVDGNPYNGVADFEGAVKTAKSSAYKLVKYQNGTNIVVATGSDGAAVVFEHELIIRGGYLIGVRMDKHNGSKELLSIDSLKSKAEADSLSDYASFYNALVNMYLYDKDNNKKNTILQTLEHKPENAKILDEGTYATMLAEARRTVDGLSTPSYAQIKNGDKWYSEDTTVLVVKEYISNFEVPSISISDKLPMTVSVPQNKLDTPANKAQFFSELGKGYLYLNYTLNIQLPSESGITQNNVVKAYFEYTSTPNDVEDVKGFKPGVGPTLGSDAPKLGDQVTNYLVPNVSITDTTRMN